MPRSVVTPPIKPVPFEYDEEDRRNIPNLDDEEFDHLTAVLKALARGSYPRLESVPLALNAYNCNRRGTADEGNPWAYFHSITTITPEEVSLKKRPVVQLDDRILDDLKKPWVSIRVGDKFGPSHLGRGNNRGKQQQQQQQQNSAQYRFICFIHKHRIDRKGTLQKGVHTISIWDREWDELTYHDTYHINRAQRRREIKRFWSHALAPGLIADAPGPARDSSFLARIRYRTVYHVSERLEDTLLRSAAGGAGAVPPRHTLWAVLGAALFHMNGARDPHVGIVPDRLELFGGHARHLLPRLFAHLLWLCLDCRGPGWTRAQREGYVRQFRILDRLRWLKTWAREHLEGYGEREREREREEGSDSETMSEERQEEEISREWMYAVLKI